MPEANTVKRKSGITIPGWAIGMIIPFLMLVGVAYVAYDKTKEIDLIDARVMSLELGAAVAGDDHQLMQKMSAEITELKSDMKLVLHALDIE